MSRKDHLSDDQDQNFLSRWSRRKTRVAQERDNAKPVVETQTDEATIETLDSSAMPTGAGQSKLNTIDAGEDQATPPDRSNEPIPSIDSLDKDSDYSRFMQPDVGAELKRIALRKLFKMPQFGIIDGLDDYDEDFTKFEALGDIITSDMRFHAERKAKLAREKAEAEAREAQLAENSIDHDGLDDDGSEDDWDDDVEGDHDMAETSGEAELSADAHASGTDQTSAIAQINAEDDRAIQLALNKAAHIQATPAVQSTATVGRKLRRKEDSA